MGAPANVGALACSAMHGRAAPTLVVVVLASALP